MFGILRCGPLARISREISNPAKARISGRRLPLLAQHERRGVREAQRYAKLRGVHLGNYFRDLLLSSPIAVQLEECIAKIFTTRNLRKRLRSGNL